jgi:hypothetical protein
MRRPNTELDGKKSVRKGQLTMRKASMHWNAGRKRPDKAGSLFESGAENLA